MHTYKIGKITRWFASAVVAAQLVMPIAPVVAQEDFTPPPADETPVVEQAVSEPVVEDSTAVVEEPPAVEVVSEEIIGDVVVEEVAPSGDVAVGEGSPQVEQTVVPSSESDVVKVGDIAETVETAPAPQLTIDKADYAPTEKVTIFGKLFQAFYSLLLRIVGGFLDGSNQVTHEDQVITDKNGAFTYEYQLDGTFRPDYTVEALVPVTGEVLAKTTFTDAIQTDFSQCSNNNPTSGSCNWIGSILQSSNSIYYEGMTVPQRLLFRDAKIVNGTHTISFTYQYTKAGIHAYDFLTTVNPSPVGFFPNQAQGNGSFTPGTPTLNACANLGTPDTTACNALNPSVNAPTAQIPVPSDSFDSKDSAPAPGTGTSQAAKEIAYQTATGGGRYITVFASSSSAFSSPSIALAHNPAGANSDTGDSEVSVTITFTSSGCNTGNGCNYLLYFGGHLAVSGSDNTTGVNWGPGLGSSQISGGPYHIKDVKFDGQGGSQDNQIKGADILVPPGSITLDKVTIPGGNPTSFNFSTTNLPAPTSPSLTDASAPQVWSNLTNGTTYTITETVPSGWLLTNRVCIGQTTSTVTNITNGVSILLAAGDNITCTFTNTLQQGNLVINKVAIGGDGTFGYTVTGPTSSTPSITTSGGAGTTGSLPVNAGSYSVSESTIPGGWDLTNAVCSNGTPANFTVTAGQTTTCTFTNTKRGTVIVKKVMVGGTGTFNFTGTPNGAISVNNGTISASVVPGQYVSTEGAADGWDLTSVTCDDANSVGNVGARTATFNVEAGETVTCTFTNTKLPKLTVVKVLSPSDDNGKFNLQINSVTYATDVGNGGTTGAQLAAVGSNTFGETAGTGTNLGNYISTISGSGCVDNGNGTGSISLAAGEEKTCTITNTLKQCKLVLTKSVDKETANVGDTVTYTITIENQGNIFCTGGGVRIEDVVDPRLEYLSETHLPAYDTIPWGISGGYGCPAYPNGSDPCVGGEPLFDGTKLVWSGHEMPPGALGTITWTAKVKPTQCGPFDITNQASATAAELNARVYSNIVHTTGSAACLKVNKILEPVNDTGLFNLQIDGVTKAANVGNSGTTGFVVVTNGTHTVGETAGTNTNLANYSAVIGGDCAADGSVTLDAGEQKTCTITNTRFGSITIIKNTVGGDGTFNFTHTITGLDESLTTSVGTASDTSDPLVPGSDYAISENALAGWDLTSAACTLQGGGSTGTVNDAAITGITVEAGKTTTCIFTNTKRGHLIVQKTTQPAGDTQVFNISASGTGTITGGGAGTVTDALDKDYEVTPGTYSVTETVPTWWDKTGDTCQNVVVSAGQTVYCQLTNVKRAQITIVKDAQPNDAQNFVFGGTLGAFTLDDDAGVVDPIDPLGEWPNSQTFNNQVPGSYTITETIPNAFWELSGVTCVNTVGGDPYPMTPVTNGVTLNLTPGADVTCTFVNVKKSPTRTQGFWQTHTAYTTSIFNAPPNTFSWFAPGSMIVGNGISNQDPITDIGKLFGGFYSNIAKKTTGAQRNTVDKARMQLAQQLIAAKLNCAAFGCPASIQTQIANADSVYATGTAAQILAAASQMDAYNNSGDTIGIGSVGKATPKTSQSIANKLFWDNP